MTSKEFAEIHQCDLEVYDESRFLGIDTEVFANLLEEYAKTQTGVDLDIQLRLLKARLKKQLAFSLNNHMQVEAQVAQAEINELEKIIKE